MAAAPPAAEGTEEPAATDTDPAADQANGEGAAEGEGATEAAAAPVEAQGGGPEPMQAEQPKAEEQAGDDDLVGGQAGNTSGLRPSGKCLVRLRSTDRMLFDARSL